MWVNAYLVKGLERGDAEGDLIPDAHLELAVLAQVNGAKEALWRDADLTAKRWLDEHRADIAALLDSRESTYKTLREMAEEPSFVFLTKPKNRLVSLGVWNAQTEEIDYFERYDGRVLVGEDGKAPAKLNAWEDVVVQTEMKCQMRVFGTGVPETRYCRVPGSWYRGPGRRSRPGCLLYSSGSIGVVALRMSKSPMRIRWPLLRRLTSESAPTLSGRASIQ